MFMIVHYENRELEYILECNTLYAVEYDGKFLAVFHSLKRAQEYVAFLERR